MRTQQFLKVFFILGFIIFTGCSRSDFLFRFADTLTVSKIDDFFDLSSSQKKLLKEDVRRDIDKGKREAFPKMAQHLRTLEHDMQKDPNNPEILSQAYAEALKHIKALTIYFQKTLIKTAMTLSPDQIHFFAKKMRDDIRKEESDPQEALEKVQKRYRRSLEYWIGSLNREQQNQLQDFLQKHPYPWRLQNQSQEFVVQQFLKASQTPATLKKFAESFAKDYESVRLPAYTQALEEHQKAFQNFLVTDFWNGLNAKQKDRFKDNLIAQADQLDRLARQ